jgi:hypothetical protein
MASHYIISLVSYTDHTLQNKKFSFSQIDEMDYEEIYSMLSDYYSTLSKFSSKEISKIACLSFFLNPFSHAKDKPEAFWGKSVMALSNFQLSLTSKGSRNLSLLNNPKTGEPPEIEEIESIKTLVDWYDLQYSILSRGSQSETGITKTSRVV